MAALPPAPVQVPAVRADPLVLRPEDEDEDENVLRFSLMARRQLREAPLLVPRKFVLFLPPEHSRTSSWGKLG